MADAGESTIAATTTTEAAATMAVAAFKLLLSVQLPSLFLPCVLLVLLFLVASVR